MSVTDGVERSEVSSAEPLADLPPSAKLVVKVLEYNDELTQGQLAEETRLPSRTVRHALGRLQDAGLVDERISFTDARKRLYSLSLA
jgi:DNA-binding MarR family transcriptional regulator